MAHKQEAAALFAQKNFQTDHYAKLKIYQADNFYLAFCNEAAANLNSLALFLGENSKTISAICNLGFAGSLSGDHQVGDLISIRNVLGQAREATGQILKNTFATANEDGTVDLLTANQRVENPGLRGKLSCHADLVDREAYWLADLAGQAGKPFFCYKVVSDMADGADNLSDIMARAEESGRAFIPLLSFDKHPPKSKPAALDRLAGLESFHFSTSQRRLVEDYLEKIRNKFQLQTMAEALVRAGVSEIADSADRPKEKTRVLLAAMAKLLNPRMGELEMRLGKLVAGFNSGPCQLKFDHQYESATLFLEGKIRNRGDYETLLANLQQLEYHKINALLNGEFDEN